MGRFKFVYGAGCYVLVFIIFIHQIWKYDLFGFGDKPQTETQKHNNFDVDFLPYTACGKWVNEYANLHRKIITNGMAPRYLISVSVEAGLGDRITGMMSEFLFAVITRRAFQIVSYPPLPGFEAAFEQNMVNWTDPGYSQELYENLKFTYKGERGYYGDRSYPPHINTSENWPIYLINEDLESDIFYGQTDLRTLPQGKSHVQKVFMASNRGRIFKLFDNPYHFAELQGMGLRPENALACAFKFLFRPNALLLRELTQLPYYDLLRNPDVLKIGIHIRVGDVYQSWDLDVRKFLGHFECAEQIEKAYRRDASQKVVWYLIADNLNVRKTAKERYGEKILTDIESKVVHTDCTFQRKCESKEFVDAQMRTALAQMISFAWCDFHVLHEDSGFGRTAAWLSSRWHNLYNAQSGKCGKSDFIPAATVAQWGAGT